MKTIPHIPAPWAPRLNREERGQLGHAIVMFNYAEHMGQNHTAKVMAARIAALRAKIRAQQVQS